MEAAAVLLFLATALFTLSLIAAPLAIGEKEGYAPGESSPESHTFVDRGAALLYDTCGLICHQRPDRSYFVDGVPMPLCERCFGIFAGMAVAFGAAAYLRPKGGFFSYLSAFVPPSLRRSARLRLVILCTGAALAAPLVLDGGLQLMTPYESTPAVRTITGVLYGIAKAGLLLGILAEMSVRIDRFTSARAADEHSG